MNNKQTAYHHLENNWRQKSIENLEKQFWRPPPEYATDLMEKVHRLRTIAIEQLQPADIRLLISQGVGLKFLVPVALEILQQNLFTDAALYKGDLLRCVMNIENDFWNHNKQLKDQFNKLLIGYSEHDKERFRRGRFKVGD